MDTAYAGMMYDINTPSACGGDFYFNNIQPKAFRQLITAILADHLLVNSRKIVNFVNAH